MSSSSSGSAKKTNPLVKLAGLVAIPMAIGMGAYVVMEPGFPIFDVVNRKSGDKVSPAAPAGAKHHAAAAADHHAPAGVNYKEVRKDIAELLEKDPEYDGIGHYGPIFVRLAWHASGTYDKSSKTGGSNGATMRFKPESDIGANAGLDIARKLLEPVKQKHGDKLSYADLWTLAGVVAIKEMGGPDVKWRPGRADAKDGTACPPHVDEKLPDATKNASHLRDIFYRMGFNDQEIVALSGAHALGKCHPDRSGFKGPWSFSPTSFTNAFFTLLLEQEWVEKKKDKDAHGASVAWKGPKQYADKQTGELMMLPTDMELIRDKEFKKWVEVYAKDQGKFFEDFAKAFGTLLELGCDKVLH